MELENLNHLEEDDFYLTLRDIKFLQKNIILKEVIVAKVIVDIVLLISKIKTNNFRHYFC